MAKFKCVVCEEVEVFIELEVEADTQEAAAQMARDFWVNNSVGVKHENVRERWVEIDGAIVETEGD
jgi:predicted TIM-barrel enzyme